MLALIFAPTFSISYYVFTLDAAYKVSTREGLNVISLADGSAYKYIFFSYLRGIGLLISNMKQRRRHKYIYIYPKHNNTT